VRSLQYLLVLFFSVVLAACGGGSSSAPAPATFTIGGTISGLTGTVALQNNGVDTLSRTTNATYTFTTAVASGAAYSATISTQPAGQTCTVANSTGTATANVTNVNITCVTNAVGTFTIGGSISGLTGTVVLQNNGGNDLSRNANGQYNFSISTTTYAVTVLTQPVGQVCTVANATGTAAAAVTNVNVTCVTNTYTIGGSISGLTGTVVLQNNAANDLSSTTNAAYFFTTQIAHGANYAVTVLSQPVGQTCTVANGSGTATAAVTNVNVTCVANTYTIGGSISGLTGTVVLQNNAANDLSRTTNAAFTFAAPITHGGAYAVTVLTQPAGQTCTIGNGSGTATANVTNITVTCGAAPTYTLSGTITGSYGEGVTITRSGTGTTTATTNAAGYYSFTGLLAGSYTLTPALAGYTYSPAAPVVAVSADTTQNFTATSVITSYSISGTVSYSGAKTGRTRVSVFYTGSCSDCSPVASTTIASPGAYTIRGLQNGSYIVKASMGYLGTGAPNATNPGGASATVNVSNANLVVTDIAMTEAAQTATTPTGLKVFPGNGSALLLWDPVYNANSVEKVTAYKIYWGTDALASNGTPIVVGARDDALYFQSGLTNGVPVYYKIASCVSGDLLCTSGEGAASAVIAPVTIGATTGSNTVSGTVTFPGTPTGHLIVAVYNPAGPFVEFTRLPVTASPMSYSIAGVASGTLGTFVAIDANDNGIADSGELNLNSNGVSFTVSGNTTNNVTLTTASANATVHTRIESNGVNPSGYELNLTVGDGFKRVRDVTLVSGLNVVVPRDMGKDWRFTEYQWLGATVPTVGSTYKFRVTFTDATIEDVSANVTGVLGLNNMAQTLVAQITTPGTNTVPLFTWAAPVSPPALYTYDMRVVTTSYGQIWEPNNNLSSGTLSALYNFDGNASIPSLTVATPYYWLITVTDANGNQATKQATYTP